MTAMKSRVGRVAGLALATMLVASACTGGGEEPPAGTPSPGTTTSAVPSDDPSINPNLAYGLDIPAGVQLTPLGSDLAVGDSATVAWQPKVGKVGVLTITVTKLVETTIKDFRGFTLDERSRNSTPYYVYATVTNAGETDLAGATVPLYARYDTDTLLVATKFTSRFKPCPSTPLPAKAFKPGAKANVCLVYLVENKGLMEAVTFRPSQEYEPIEWTGTIQEPKPATTRKPKPSGTASPTASPTS